MERANKLLVVILVSSLVSNVILLGTVAGALWLVNEVDKQIESISQRLDRVHEAVSRIKQIGATVKDRVRQRTPQDGTEKSPPADRPLRPVRPLERLRQNR